jgi:shikimate kinase
MGTLANIRQIVLLGPKHSGKSIVGRELAKLLGGDFVDLDDHIEALSGKSPRALYRESPERFRAEELRALEDLCPPPNAAPDCLAGDFADGKAVGTGGESAAPGVIAAGGGLIDNEAGRELLRSREGFCLVYLDVSVDTAWERISGAAAQTGELPPLLNTDKPRETHRLLHERRAAAYRELCNLTISGENKTPTELGQAILERLMS